MKNGPYELIKAPPGYPGMLYRGKYAYEHHVVWWQMTGRMPLPGHVIHHKNDQKRDNRFENFEEMENGAHTGRHSAERAKPLGEMHGTLTAYRHRGCRCDECRAVNTATTNEWRWRTGKRKRRAQGAVAQSEEHSPVTREATGS